ncbi:MAG: hypothetical protein WCP92_00750 [bacterium]
MITNFSTIDATSKTAPYLSTYVKAKIAFDEDIKSLITLNTPAPKTEKEKDTPRGTTDDVYYSADNTTEKISKELEKLKGLSEITTEIGYLIQLKNLEAGNEPGTDFNADKLKTFVKDNNLEKNMAPKDTKRNRFQIISEKNILVEAATTKKTIEDTNAANAKEAINKTRTKETAKDFFETKANEDTFNAVFKDIASITATNIETYKTTDTDKTNENKVKNFVNLLQKYTKDDKISSISLKVA